MFKLEDLVIGVAIVLIAAAFAYGGMPSSNLFRLFVAVIFCILGLASMNSINQVFDVEIDKINKPNRPLPQIYAKANIFFSTVVIGFGYGILMFLVGWGVYRPIEAIPIWLIIFLYTHEVFIVLCKDFSDVEGDRQAGISTIPIIYGKARGAVLALILYLTAFMLLLIFQLTNTLTLNFYPTIIVGLFFGLLIFGFCSFQEKKFNYIGYSFYVVGTIVVRMALLFAFIG